MNKRIILLSFIFSLLSTFQLFAQLNDCIIFNEPAVGTLFSSESGVSPGDTVHTYGDVYLSMGNYQDNVGNTTFVNMGIDSFSQTSPSSFLFANFSTATFHYPETQSSICFLAASLSGYPFNMGINGGEVFVFENFLSLEGQNLFPDHTITVQEDGNFVYVCIEGGIEMFTIGGVEFLLDDICTTSYPPDCFSNNFDIDLSCINNSTLSLVIDFDPVGTDNDFFDLFINDEFYAFYSFNDLPIAILNPPFNNLQNLEIRIQENDNPDCVYTELLTLPPCFYCHISNLSVSQLSCDEDTNTYTFLLDLDHNHPTTVVDSFILNIDGIPHGTFSYIDLPLSLELTVEAGAELHFLVYDQNMEECAEDISVEVYPCQSCGISNIVLSPTECDDSDSYYIDVTFETSHAQDSFIIILDGDIAFGPFLASDMPFTVGPVYGGGGVHTATVEVLHINGYCSGIEEITHSCIDDCFSAEIDFGECHEDGSSDLIIYLDATTSASPIIVAINSTVIGSYEINEFPLTLHGIIPANNLTHTVSIYQEVGNCSFSQEVINPCTDCGIFDVSITGTACDSDNMYYIILSFAADSDQAFLVFNTSSDIVYTAFPGIPLEMGPFDFDEQQTSEITIAHLDNPCQETYVFTQVCEPSEECNFSNISAEGYACEEGLFLVDIEFDNPFGGDLGFYIFGDGMIFGPFQYGENYYTFGPLNSTLPSHTILLLDIADPSCFGNYAFDFTCTDDCQITAVYAEEGACNDDGLFYVTLGVEAVNHGDNFTVVGNGNNYGEFSYDELPITLGPFNGDGETEYEFGVIDLQNADCTNWTAIVSPNCQPCNIWDFNYEVNCREESYDLLIDFQYENTESEYFAIIIGNQVYEWFNYSDLPLTLDYIPFSFNGETIRVEDVNNEACGQTLDFNLPCCNIDNILNELEVTACEATGEYYLRVHGFDGVNLSDSLVIDYAPAGSSIIATVTVAYSDLAEDIGPLTGNGSTGYLFVFRDQENQCTVTHTLEPVFCDDSSCVEFEGEQGVFGPGFGYDSGDLILEENDVQFTYERNPVSNCACNLFILNQMPGVNFGNNNLVITQNSGFGLDFSNVQMAFNTVNIDFYHPAADVSISVNGQEAITAAYFNEFPADIAPGVTLQVISFGTTPQLGMLSFSGEIESIQLFSNETAAFDNVCMSLDNEVWPGDTNADNYAGHFDLLNIGIAYGSAGPNRNSVNAEWAGFIGQNWSNSFANGINYKHADANGDGIVNNEDQVVLEQNYGLAHGTPAIYEALPYTDTDPPIFLVTPDENEFPSGTAFEIPINVGSVDQAVNDIYGLAFTLTIDPNVIDLSSLEIIYPTSWFGEPDVNIIHLHHINDDGMIEVAISRKDLNPVSGFGTIMYLRGIIDDIIALTPSTQILMDKVYAIDRQENPIFLRPGNITLNISQTTPTIDREMLRNSFSIYPNPARDIVYFSNYYNMPADKISIYNSNSQLLSTVNKPNNMELNISQLPPGVYHLKIHLQGFIFTKRLVKIK